MPRKFATLTQSFDVETPFGLMKLRPLDADRITLETARSTYNEPPAAILVNKVPLHASLTLTKYGERWEPTRDAHGATFGALYARRADSTSAHDDASSAARSKLLTFLPSIVEDWAEEHADALEIARRVQRNNEAHYLEQKIEEHEAALAKLRAELAAVEAQL